MAEEKDTLETPFLNGAFVSSLTRNNKQIKKDRAEAIAEDLEIFYKRKIQDIEQLIKKLNRRREGMLDLSPTDANSLVVAANEFDSEGFLDEDLKIGLEIRNESIKLEILKERYNYLFGTK